MIRAAVVCASVALAIPAVAQVRDVTIAAIPGVIAADARWALAWSGTDNADGIVGTADGGLIFAQEQPSQVSTLDTHDRASVYLEDTHGAGSLSIDARGQIVAALRTCTDPGNAGRGITAPCTEPTGIALLTPMRRVLADNIDGKPLGRINDLVAAKNGSVYFTSGGAFRLSPAGRVSAIGSDLRTNGIMLSPDERTLYVTNGSDVVAFDVAPDGTAVNQRTLARLRDGGNGDGMTIDAAGRLYVTSAPGVQVFGSDGAFLGIIPTPRPVISVAFSGAGKKTLYVVGAGALGPDGREIQTAQGIRNNAKSIFRIRMLAAGFAGRPK
jgi:gluconolactonase